MLTGEPVEPQVRICYPSFDMAGVGKHVKNGQGNHHITFQAKVSDRFPSLQKLGGGGGKRKLGWHVML